jgi:hypothetical protein
MLLIVIPGTVFVLSMIIFYATRLLDKGVL